MCFLWSVVCECKIRGHQLKWGAVECAHTHITRSDCLEELVASRKWVGVLLQRVLQRQRSGIGLDGLSMDPTTNKKIIHVETCYK